MQGLRTAPSRQNRHSRQVWQGKKAV